MVLTFTICRKIANDFDGTYILEDCVFEREEHDRSLCSKCRRFAQKWTSSIDVSFLETGEYPNGSDGIIIPSNLSKGHRMIHPKTPIKFGKKEDLVDNGEFVHPFVTYYGSQDKHRLIDTLISWEELKGMYEKWLSDTKNT